jgi:hypothetical protein
VRFAWRVVSFSAESRLSELSYQSQSQYSSAELVCQGAAADLLKTTFI